MKKHAKVLVSLILALVFCMSGISAFASEADNGISPRLSHVGSGAFSFVANENGGHVDISYEGYKSSFVQAKVTVKLEKRFLLVFWNEIDTWTASSTEVWGDFVHTFALNGKGTYRATMTLEVTGIDGTVDVISDVMESTY